MSKSKQQQQPISAAGESSQCTILVDEGQTDKTNSDNDRRKSVEVCIIATDVAEICLVKTLREYIFRMESLRLHDGKYISINYFCHLLSHTSCTFFVLDTRFIMAFSERSYITVYNIPFNSFCEPLIVTFNSIMSSIQKKTNQYLGMKHYACSNFL